MSANQPRGIERNVVNTGRASIDGAPIAYIVVLASVVTALAFIPFTVVLALGGSFPMSQGVFSLMGWILGPVAGAVASGMGALIGVFVAPHTSSVWFVTVLGGVVAAFAAGTMRPASESRKYWWIGVAVVAVIGLLVYMGRAIFINNVSPHWVLLATFVNWTSLLLFILPSRKLVAGWIGSKKVALVALGLAFGTYICFGMAHTINSAITYSMFNWPEEVWVVLSTAIPVEFLSRAAIAAVIGTGVIVGLRAIGLVKPIHATY